MRPKLLFFVSFLRNLTLKCENFSSLKEIVSYFRILDIKLEKTRNSIVSAIVLLNKGLCIINVWSSTEILPQFFYNVFCSPKVTKPDSNDSPPPQKK